MVLAGDRVSRGLRVQDIQRACGDGDDNGAFAERLNRAADELGVASEWTANRVSKVRNGLQGLSIEDMTVVARVDPEQRGWTWVSYGQAISPGEDAWAVLAKQAKRKGKTA